MPPQKVEDAPDQVSKANQPTNCSYDGSSNGINMSAVSSSSTKKEEKSSNKEEGPVAVKEGVVDSVDFLYKKMMQQPD